MAVLQDERNFRAITEMVMRCYCEFADGFHQVSEGRMFDTRLINYRIDVERVLNRLEPWERLLLNAIHLENMTQQEAAKAAGISAERYDHLVARVETKVGRLFDRAGLGNLLTYFS